MEALINGSFSEVNGCKVQHYRGTNQVSLRNDAGTGWLGPGTLGAAGQVQNSQCTINLQSSSASGSGNNLTLNLDLTFAWGFAGDKTIWMYVQDLGALNSGWQSRGSWTVPSSPGPMPPPQGFEPDISGAEGPPAQGYPQCGSDANVFWLSSSIQYVSPGQTYGQSETYSTGTGSWNNVNYTSARMLRDGQDLGSNCSYETTSVSYNVARQRVPCNASIHFYVYAPSFYTVVGRHRTSNSLTTPTDSAVHQSYASLGFIPAGAARDFTVLQSGLTRTSQATGPTIDVSDGTTATYLVRSDTSVSIRVTVPYTARKGKHVIGFPTTDICRRYHRNENLTLVVYDDTPVITDVSPGSIPADTPTTLTISGSGFGDRPTVYVAGTAYAVSTFQHLGPGEDRVTVSVNLPASQAGSSVSVYLVSNGAGGQAFFGKPLGPQQGSPTSNTRQVQVVGPPTISGNQGIWYLGVAAVNDNCDPASPVPSCYYNSTQLTLTAGPGGTPPTASSPASWSLTDLLTGQAPLFASYTCGNAECSQVVIRATSQPPTCGRVEVRATLGGISSEPYSVTVDWPSVTTAVFWQDDSYQDPNNPSLSGYYSNNTLQLRSACGLAIFNMAAHEEFPGRPTACGGSVGWTDPIPQNEWGNWITEPPGNNAGMFIDQILFACTPGACTPQPRAPGNPLSSQANSSVAQFIFVGSQDTQNLGKYLTAAPNMQVLYTDHGRDEPGTWRCPGQ